MAKEKNYNPVQAQRKADKAKAVKKNRTEAQDRRNEKLARKNPDRIQKQIDDLKAITTKGGKLTRHEEQVLEGLEKEFKAVSKARETLGDKAPSFGKGWTRDRDGDAGPGVLGKRRRDPNDSSSDDDVPDDVKNIPMPRDTPPPIPKEVLDKWYAKRRARREAANAAQREDNQGDKPETRAAPAEAQTVYEAKPVMRDLRKEAVTAFVPTAVKMKIDKGQGQGGLMEPEEADKLEQEGYLKLANQTGQGPSSEPSRAVTMEEADDDEEEY